MEKNCNSLLFGQTVRLIKNLGFDVVRAQELGMAGSGDKVIYHKAQELGSILITNDQGFGDIRSYAPGAHSGIVVLKMLPDPNAIQQVHRVLEVLLKSETDFEGILFVVDRRKYRKRTTS